MIKIKKRKKSSRMHGKKMGTHGWGARKKHKKSGHRGGKGMSGSGKRADHKKTLVIKLYGHKYFGKQGITSKGTKKDKENRINLRDIELNLSKYSKDVKSEKIEINLSNYKILGTGEVKNRLIIKAKSASKSAREKVEAKGGEIILARSPQMSKQSFASRSRKRLLKRDQTKAKGASKKAIDKVKEKGEILLKNK